MNARGNRPGDGDPSWLALHLERAHADAVLGLDIDGTITASPAHFSRLSRAWRASGREVHIISARSDADEVRLLTHEELEGFGIAFDELHLLPGPSHAHVACPHLELDWNQRYLWQKVAVAQRVGVRWYFDDDPVVVGLFRRFAPKITVCGGPPWPWDAAHVIERGWREPT